MRTALTPPVTASAQGQPHAPLARAPPDGGPARHRSAGRPSVGASLPFLPPSPPLVSAQACEILSTAPGRASARQEVLTGLPQPPATKWRPGRCAVWSLRRTAGLEKVPCDSHLP